MIQYFEPLMTAFQALNFYQQTSLGHEYVVDRPCSVRILMEGASASFRAYDEPPTIRSSITQDREEVFAERLWRPVVAIPSNTQVHLLHERAVKEIKRALIPVVVHVVDVCF